MVLTPEYNISYIPIKKKCIKWLLAIQIDHVLKANMLTQVVVYIGFFFNSGFDVFIVLYLVGNFFKVLGIVNEFQTCKDQVQSCKTCRGVSNSEHLGH